MKDKKEKSRKIKLFDLKYPLKVLFITLIMSFILNISSEALLSNVGLIVSIIILIVFIGVSILFDMIGVAVTAGNLEPFLSRASKKERGAKEAIKLIKNAEKISSFCCDIVGDSCGILTGAVGASIVVRIYAETGDFYSVLIAALVSSVIAAITVLGKAFCKSLAVNKSDSIILRVGKILSVFNLKKRKSKKQ